MQLNISRNIGADDAQTSPGVMIVTVAAPLDLRPAAMATAGPGALLQTRAIAWTAGKPLDIASRDAIHSNVDGAVVVPLRHPRRKTRKRPAIKDPTFLSLESTRV